VSFRPARIASDDDPSLALEALKAGDLPQIRSWLAAPHLAPLWSPSDVGTAEIAAHMAEPCVAPYLIVEGGRP